MNARAAASLVRKELMTRELPFTRITARTIGFMDLARVEKVFVKVEGWKPNPAASEIKEIGAKNGFVVTFVSPDCVCG